MKTSETSATGRAAPVTMPSGRQRRPDSGAGAAVRCSTRTGAVAALLLWATFAGTVAAADAPANRAESARGDATVGEALARRWCSQCHLIDGANKATDAAPPFVAIARSPTSTPEHLRTLLSRQHVSMPQLPLSGTEADDLIAYILKVGR